MKTSKQRTEEILRRADARRAARATVRRRAVILAVAAGLLLLVAFQFVLFLPYPTGLPDLSRFAGSPYYGLMQQLNALTYTPPRYQNNFQAWFGPWLLSGAAPEWPGDSYPAPDGDAQGPTAEGGGAHGSTSDGGGAHGSTSDGGNGSVEVTDNQEAGVIEGDLFKRTDSHIFYLQRENGGTYLTAYTIAQGNSALCGRLEIAAEANTYIRNYGLAEMYLSEDGDTALLLVPVYSYEEATLFTAVISVDVSDPVHMRETARLYVSGSYVASRTVQDELLLVSNFTVRKNPDFSDETQFLPQIGALDSLESLPVEDIVWSEGASAARYTVLCRLGPDLSVRGSEAFLSFSQGVYVSQENVFLTRAYITDGQACGENVSYSFRESRTEIACVRYAGGGLAYRGSADVAGSVLNQYSMDEEDGMLRVVTTRERSVYDVAGSLTFVGDEQSAALYAVDLSDLTVAAALENFAPQGEEVTSVRFEEDVAWVCTAVVIQWSDPVFRIDLSDLSNITFTETGDIDGYSSSLIDFTDGTLLGVGYGDGGTFKAEIYEQTEQSVVSVAVYERDARFSEDYKAYLIDRERGLLGLQLYDFTSYTDVYVLLHFDGYTLAPALELETGGGSEHTTRACIAEDWLYVVGEWGGILAAPLPGLA